MYIYPMKKLIIIYGWHLDQIQPGSSEERLLKILKEKSFVSNLDFTNFDIEVFKSLDFSNHYKRTHIIINLNGDISEIKYYTTKQ